jgi:menaquinone-dependent protoporphyrinogen IX oxidase
MKVCVLYCDIGSSTQCKELALGLSEGIQTLGHDVDTLDMQRDTGKIISYYDYIAVGTVASSLWGGKIPEMVDRFLKQCGTISGKRSFAFIGKKGIRQGKTLQTLMRVMESQGMYLTYSDVLSNRAYAKEVGKRLVIS